MKFDFNVFSNVFLATDIFSNSDKKISGLSTWDTFAQLFTILVIFIIVLVGAYYSTKLLGKAQGQRFKGGNIEVIETISIANGKVIQLIRIGSKYIVISVTKDRVEFLAEVPADQIKIKEIPEQKAKNSFDDILRKVISKKGRND
jgi:flagellar protein FliO/FliZ